MSKALKDFKVQPRLSRLQKRHWAAFMNYVVECESLEHYLHRFYVLIQTSPERMADMPAYYQEGVAKTVDTHHDYFLDAVNLVETRVNPAYEAGPKIMSLALDSFFLGMQAAYADECRREQEAA